MPFIKGYKMSEEHKAKIGKSNSTRMKDKWEDVEYRKMIMSKRNYQYMRGNKFSLGQRPSNFKHGLSQTSGMKAIYENKRRSLKYKTLNRLTMKEWEEIKTAYQNKCACCRKEEKLTIDHIIPLSLGGDDSKDNVQPLCMPCNRNKFTSTIRYEIND